MTDKENMQDRRYEEVVAYHDRTKHHYHRYARSAGHMDWQNQPVPFRFYDDAFRVDLPFLPSDPPVSQTDLFRRSDMTPAPFTIENISGLLELSLGLSAWKAMGRSRWSLRMNPSSGNLHPTEAYLIVPETGRVPAGLYHYNPYLHALERRCLAPPQLWQQIESHFSAGGFLIGLSSIFWRESWKYGERAFRYCNHDVGHAVAGLSLAAGLWGWRFTYLNALSDRDVAVLLGLDRTSWHQIEDEHPDLVGFVTGRSVADLPRGLPEDVMRVFEKQPLEGRPNRLSNEPVRWQIIDDAADATCKPAGAGHLRTYGSREFVEQPESTSTAAAVIRRRRSATSFDPQATIDAQQFEIILDKTMPRDDCPPFDSQIGDSFLHLLIFVHQVIDMPPGLYFMLRDPERLSTAQQAFRPEFDWKPVSSVLPLYMLQTGDYRHEAIEVSCHQDIAGYSVFSLGMIAEFDRAVQPAAWHYRQLFWEAGMIGQALYLEAEAQGVRGTGIGCYFDDPVHDMIGVADHSWQSMYHFTVGIPVDDPRLTTFPAYHHLEDNRRSGEMEP